MAYVKGIVQYVSDVSDEERDSVVLHLHSDGRCYSAIFHDGQAYAIGHLLQKGDEIGLTGTISEADHGLGWDIDVAEIHTTIAGKPQILTVDYRNQYAPS